MPQQPPPPGRPGAPAAGTPVHPFMDHSPPLPPTNTPSQHISLSPNGSPRAVDARAPLEALRGCSKGTAGPNNPEDRPASFPKKTQGGIKIKGGLDCFFPRSVTNLPICDCFARGGFCVALHKVRLAYDIIVHSVADEMPPPPPEHVEKTLILGIVGKILGVSS